MRFHAANMLTERGWRRVALRSLAAGIALMSIATATQAQAPSADERAIRDLIARYDRGESIARTDDVIVWSGEFKQPSIGAEKGEPLPPEQRPSAFVPPAPSERVQGSRRRVTTPVRIEIAKSGDLAYEFSNSDVRFDLKSGQEEITIPASVLRVWKKDGGQWKIAAMFARPHYQEPIPSTAK